MIASSDIKSIVAQSCPGYSPLSGIFMASMTNLAYSCSTCYNNIRGKCEMDLFDDIWSKVSRN